MTTTSANLVDDDGNGDWDLGFLPAQIEGWRIGMRNVTNVKGDDWRLKAE